ncbi:MAG: hypothetical protein AAF411_27940 [Myxococcota bacterium]
MKRVNRRCTSRRWRALGKGRGRATHLKGGSSKAPRRKPEPNENRNACEDAPDASWTNVEADDPFVVGGDGTDIAQRAFFGRCEGGDVLGYRFRDEGHDADYEQHFEPDVRAIHIAWDFFMGRQRNSGHRGSGSVCWPE